MTRAIFTLRAIPGGAPAPGVDYDIYRESDLVTPIASGVTDAEGRISYTVNGSPGPWRWEATDEVPEDPVTRVGSSISAGSGGTYSLYEVPIVLRALLNGVVAGYLEGLLVEDPGSGTNVRVNTGAALVKGIPVVWYSDATHAIVAAQDATHPRACYVGVTVTGLGEAEEGKAVLTDHCGTAAASPVLPSLTSLQTDASYFLPLATFVLGITGSSNPDAVTVMTDVRTYLGTRNPLLSSTVRRTDLVTPTTTMSTTGADIADLVTSVVLLDGVAYDIEAWGAVLVKAPAGQTVSIAPSINGDVAEFVATGEAADYVLLENAHAASAVVGTGAAIPVVMRWRVSGGTGSALTGILTARATPRS